MHGLNTSDGAEYLFSAETHVKMVEWIERINFHARLAPSNQLASFKTGETSVGDDAPLYTPPKPNELTRSHTLELPSSTTPRNTGTMYYAEGQVKSATIDPRRSTFSPTYLKESSTLSYDVNEVKAMPLLINTTTNPSSSGVNFKSPTPSQGASHRPYTQTSPQGTQSVGGNSSSSGGGFTQSQQNFLQNSSNNGEDAEFVSWVETSSLAGGVRTGGTLGLGAVGNGISLTSC